MARGHEYYIGLYFWRLDKFNMRVSVYTQEFYSYHWNDSDQFQTLKDHRFDNWVRWVSKKTLLDEAHKIPMQVKDAGTMRDKRKQGV